MRGNTMRIGLAAVLPLLVVTGLVGCDGFGEPDCVDVSVGDTSECVPPGSGIAELANTQWVLLDGLGNPIVTLVFDANGSLAELAESDLLADFLEGDFILDGEERDLNVAALPTSIPASLRYSATAASVELAPVEGVTQFSIGATVDVFVILILKFPAATGNIDIVNGTIDGDTMTGELRVSVTIDPGFQQTILDFSGGTVSEEDLALFEQSEQVFPFTATRLAMP